MTDLTENWYLPSVEADFSIAKQRQILRVGLVPDVSYSFGGNKVQNGKFELNDTDNFNEDEEQMFVCCVYVPPMQFQTCLEGVPKGIPLYWNEFNIL
ncbi:hypothetical protein RUM43_005393 [Polyplax serrata]|uniref:Uncharacterized protein n=1 Tax=Polyplax serrata TaxID=468196 RepID=A0AAN8NVZ1_POLSC